MFPFHNFFVESFGHSIVSQFSKILLQFHLKFVSVVHAKNYPDLSILDRQ